MKRVDSKARRVLILAPTGRDGVIARRLLAESGIDAEPVRDLAALVSELKAGAGSAIIAEEALHSANITALADWLHDQPPWSDFPIILLAQHGGGPERNPAARRWAEILGNITVIERPFHPTTLTAAVVSAGRSRWRQYEARARTEELRESEERLSALNATLEDRVARRTDELMAEVAAREKAQDQLRQAQKMESIGQLTGGIAHDFNNLLMVVMSALVLLRRRGAAAPNAPQLIDGAIQAAERGAALTQRLLAFARQQDLKTSAVDLGQLIGGMRDMLDRALGPRFTVITDIAPGLPSAQVDANQVELAILNLVINARDAMADGGDVRIAVAEEALDAESGMRPGPYLAIRVADSGTGMDAETLKKAIEPFFSTKAVGKGTGLGLSMVHGLAVQLGGGFTLESRPGSGTIATIYVPRAMRSHHRGQDRRSSDAELAPMHVLLVDDDALVAALTSEMLGELGHTVTLVHSAKAALELLRSGIEVDLVLTDYLMPGMTGLELIERVRHARPGLLVLLATGFAEMSDRMPPDIPRISKPYDLESLRDRLAEIQQGRPPASAGTLRERPQSRSLSP